MGMGMLHAHRVETYWLTEQVSEAIDEGRFSFPGCPIPVCGDCLDS